MEPSLHNLLLPLTIALCVSLTSTTSGSEEIGDVVTCSQALGDVAELREEVRQLEHEGREDGLQLREEMLELRREKREEIQRIREEETEETQQLRDEVEMLREEGRRLKGEVPKIQELLRNTMLIFIKLQDHVLDMEHEKAERDVQHQEQLAALNSTIANMFHHHHHLTALNTSITEHELERKGDIQRLQESLSVLNDSLLHNGGAVTQEDLLQCCRNESQATSLALTQHLLQLDHRLDALNATKTRDIDNDTVASNCSGNKVLFGMRGSLAVPSNEYKNNMDCSWRVEVPYGSLLVLKWRYFLLESRENCDYDWVTVMDDSGHLFYGGKMCGTKSWLRENSDWIVKTNRLDVVFHSDGSNTYGGFYLEYQALLSP